MQAVILAAGMGKRLKELTRQNTKCMVKVDGVPLIDRMLNQIEKHNLSRIIIVVGYEGQELIEHINSLDIKTPVLFIENHFYYKTNNIYSLALVKDWLLKEDTILFESDIIFEDSVLDVLINDPRDTLALVDRYESWMDGTCVKLATDDSIKAFITKKDFKFSEIDEYYKTINIYKFSQKFSETQYVPFLEAYKTALGENEYYEQVLRVLTMLDNPVIKAKRIDNQKWYEIDDIQDLDIAESIFTKDEDRKIELVQNRYGGYWRYPRLRDFCYLVNPYYPSIKMKEELRTNFDTLLTEYPSGMQVISLLAAKNFDINQKNILAGNGAAELIRSLMYRLEGITGFIRPTFEEYPNRYDIKKSVCFIPDNQNYSYTADNIIEFFNDKNINNLIVINPDNPSGNYICKTELVKLVDWGRKKEIRLIVDESFSDFADEIDNTLIDKDLIVQNSHLFVIKSISKSHGVPGLRLGVLVSGDEHTISEMKEDAAIWNINSFAEFYLQIEEKYRRDYRISLDKIRAERKRFQNELAKIKGIRVIPSQANFVMIELLNDSSKDILKKMYIKHNLLIKELADKMNGRNYLRLTVRDAEDNDILINVLKEEINNS